MLHARVEASSPLIGDEAYEDPRDPIIGSPGGIVMWS